MQTEFEATFYPIGKDEMQTRLKEAGAKLEYPERLMRRVTFHMPEGHRSIHKWARVRDEGDKITMSVKEVQDGGGIEAQKEAMVTLTDFEEGVEFLKAIGCREKSYQETRRELWTLDGVEITLDEWPFLYPLVEIEGKSEEAVRAVGEKLGFAWSEAKFYPAGAIYMEKYGKTEDHINNGTPRIVFGEPNPFV
mgnify:CR=1 FL=1